MPITITYVEFDNPPGQSCHLHYAEWLDGASSHYGSATDPDNPIPTSVREAIAALVMKDQSHV